MKQFNLDEYLAFFSTEKHEGDNKRFGIKIDKIDGGLSFGTCISYDKYNKECYLFINLIKWGVSIGWLTFERKEK